MRPQGTMPRGTAHGRRAGTSSRLLRLAVPACALLFALPFVLAVAGCGAGPASGIKPIPTSRPPTYVSGTPGQQSTPTETTYAYLYSRVDYPLQVPVNQSDTVTLTLSPKSNILEVAPATGSGSTTVGGPIPLPTDLQNYSDIGATVDTVAAHASPIVWQLVSAPRQSLLTPQDEGPRRYLDRVMFRWRVEATSAGQNLVTITLHLYYIYLDHSEHDGTIQTTQTPIPIIAVQPTTLNTTLPALRLPLAGISGLAGLLAVLRFVWGAFKAVGDATSPVRDAAEVAGMIRHHAAGRTSGEKSGLPHVPRQSREAHSSSPAPHQPRTVSPPPGPHLPQPPASKSRASRLLPPIPRGSNRQSP